VCRKARSDCVLWTASWFTFQKLCIILFVILLIVMVLLEYILREVDHISSILAPILILVGYYVLTACCTTTECTSTQVTFYQTLALLLDLAVPWPDVLKDWMVTFSFLNVSRVG
jgi:hypothetical protein